METGMDEVQDAEGVTSCKLLNRVVPNGTLRGVEGEDKLFPIRFI